MFVFWGLVEALRAQGSRVFWRLIAGVMLRALNGISWGRLMCFFCFFPLGLKVQAWIKGFLAQAELKSLRGFEGPALVVQHLAK